MDESHDNASVLVVDDESAIRYTVSKVLQKVGYRVEDVASGELALSALQTTRFDVVLADIRMPPGLDGVELLGQIKEHDADAVVILMTGYPSLSTAVEAMRLGAFDYLMKPSSNQDLRQSVARGVERAHNLRRRRELLEIIRSNFYELDAANDDTTPFKFNGDRSTPAPDAGENGANAGQIVLGPLVIYMGRYQISIEGRLIDLTPTEFDLLLYLTAHRERVISCHELVREVRGYSINEAEAREVIRPHVSNLRRKVRLMNSQDADVVVNVRGIGYRLNEHLE